MESSQSLFILRSGNKPDIDPEDLPELRARPTWVSAEESIENIQNEINITVDAVDGKKNISSLGRSQRRDIRINLKAVSADHCTISYFPMKGWTITEKGKSKPSSNGTYIFLKSLKQMRDHMPSDLIELHEGMTLSFVNYEVKIKFQAKSEEALRDQLRESEAYFTEADAAMQAAKERYAAAEADEAAAEPKAVEEVQPAEETFPPAAEEPAAVIDAGPVEDDAPVLAAAAVEESKAEEVPAEEVPAVEEKPVVEEQPAQEPPAEEPQPVAPEAAPAEEERPEAAVE